MKHTVQKDLKTALKNDLIRCQKENIVSTIDGNKFVWRASQGCSLLLQSQKMWESLLTFLCVNPVFLSMKTVAYKEAGKFM